VFQAFTPPHWKSVSYVISKNIFAVVGLWFDGGVFYFRTGGDGVP